MYELIVFCIICVVLLLIFLRDGFRFSEIKLRRFLGFLAEFLKKIRGRGRLSTAELIDIAYRTWLAFDYPAGKALSWADASPDVVEQAGLLVQALVARRLEKEGLPEEIKEAHREILELNPFYLGNLIRENILNGNGANKSEGVDYEI